MDKKELMSQVAELEELDEESLSQVWGGGKPKFKPPNLPPGKPSTVAGTRR
jgi:hypothetical protein